MSMDAAHGPSEPDRHPAPDALRGLAAAGAPGRLPRPCHGLAPARPALPRAAGAAAVPAE
ncbi:hypothetical protein M446_5233 [Methylobacterium sp. 4-46]|uniref:hypothetical protein n=2 Tax=unclassified Methylobacterium TaxID=2615210 RepID=UPI000165CAE6|nr:hypothetical protein [Methylobacterium sp. 4-46]ACA19557.1 hypothetical protein M446_5233 [Methylobacterium sp. 4-46]